MEVYIKLPLDDPLGSLLLAVFFGCMLYSQELVLILNHFRHRPADNPLQSAMLAVLFANDTLAMANEINMVYGYLISNWGNIAFLAFQGWNIPAFCVTAGVSALACQGFLVLRVHKLGKNWLLTVPLALVACAALSGALWSAYVGATTKMVADRAKSRAPISMWLIAAVVGDVGIAAVLLGLLYRARKVASQFEGSTLVGPLTRMMILTIETGGLTAVIALIALVLFLKTPSSNAVVGLGFVLGRIYALTILFCLRQRGSADRDRRDVAFNSSGGQYSSSYQHKSRTVGAVSVPNQSTLVIGARDEHELSSFAGRAGARRPTYVVGTAGEDEADEKGSYGRMDSA